MDEVMEMEMATKASHGKGNKSKMIRTRIETSKCEVGRGCFTITQTEEKGRARFAWPSMRPDGAYLYANKTDRTSMLRAECELMKMKKGTNPSIVLLATSRAAS